VIIQIINLLRKQLPFTVRDEDYQKLLDMIPVDKSLRMKEVFEILRNSQISVWADYASLELNQEVKSKSCLRCLPAWFYRWLKIGKAEKKLAEFKDQTEKPSIMDILMHFDTDCSEFYSVETVMKIVEIFENSLVYSISPEEKERL
jgi:hypothetical protein